MNVNLHFSDLVPLTSKEKIRYSTNQVFRKETDDKIKKVILDRLNNKTITPAEIETFIKNKVAPLSFKQFDRTSLRATHAYTVINSEGQLATWAGIKFKRNFFGTSGSYRVRDLSGKTIGIFKPTRESPHGPENPHFWIRVRNWVQKFFCLNRCTNEALGAKAEVCAYKFSQILNFSSLVPRTSIATFSSNSFKINGSVQEGSYQDFVENAHDGYKQMKIYSWMPPFLAKLFLPKNEATAKNMISERSFHEFALHQCLIGNIDGNYGNMLFQKGSTNIIAIDAWFSMPHSPPTSYLDRRGMHAWDTLVWANKPIPIDFKNLLQSKEIELLNEVELQFGKKSKEHTQFKLRLQSLIKNIDGIKTWRSYTSTQ